jgi:hypothetical protein
MSNNQQHLEVLTKDQAASVDRIKLFLRSERRGFEDALCFFYLSGVDLLALRETSTHGNADAKNSFKLLCEREFPDLPKTSIYQRIGLVEAAKVQSLNFSKKTAQITNEIPEEVKAPILKEIHEHSDGKSITAVLRDLDIIRQPKTPGTYERKPRDLRKQIEAAGEVDESACADWCADTLMLLDEKANLLGGQKTATLQKMENIRLQLGQRIQKILKSRGGASARALNQTQTPARA